MKTFIFGAAALLSIASTLAPQGAQAQQAGIHRQQLSQHDLSMPGWEEFQQRLDVDPGKTAPNHRHPGEEIIYVIEGTLEYTLQGQPPVTLKAGDVLFVPVGVIHSAKNVGTTNAAELGTYIVPKGKPLIEWIK
ncbi:cupin domain-containing protein [Dyella humicola]|uniref:cupin domain-containing protein n=1 Tax=Dyella humicola TaxID=2992126 RepID=UPI00225AE210|nr:cupin domain-containing protein [Dyella humicola]